MGLKLSKLPPSDVRCHENPPKTPQPCLESGGPLLQGPIRSLAPFNRVIWASVLTLNRVIWASVLVNILSVFFFASCETRNPLASCILDTLNLILIILTEYY